MSLIALKNEGRTKIDFSTDVHSAMLSGATRSNPSADGRTPGGVVRGGKNNHRLRPRSVAFQADVPLGSLCHALPDRAPPTMSQRQSGLRPSRSPNRSSSKYFGGL